jgi:sulfoxide reductase catalytic subunit YedY
MSDDLRSEITPEFVYLNRRQFIKGALTLAGAAALAACGGQTITTVPAAPTTSSAGPTSSAASAPALQLPPALAHADPYVSVQTDELGQAVAEFKQVTNYNNFYEFSLDKEEPASLAQRFKPLPWTVEVTGLVNKPRTFSMEEIYSMFPHEERIYRLRCVEGWSFVIPWVGFPMSALLNLVEPKPEAKFVKFITVLRPEEMPGQRVPMLKWPYVEGLRLDEAMHPLAIMATGMYGKPLPNQDGAPIRMVVPWKYGFKSGKSINKIELVAAMPDNTWKVANGSEYGFYANVNPKVDHPRWTQATERRIGTPGRRPTLMFNGYEKEVAHLYEGLDLVRNY